MGFRVAPAKQVALDLGFAQISRHAGAASLAVFVGAALNP